jgi:elongator complex protein 3
LMLEAEKISREEFDAKNLLVISAVGTREYYQKLGYSLYGPYMAKKLI